MAKLESLLALLSDFVFLQLSLGGGGGCVVALVLVLVLVLVLRRGLLGTVNWNTNNSDGRAQLVVVLWRSTMVTLQWTDG